MKNITLILLLLLSQVISAQTFKTKEERMEWWKQSRFGMFIHWGPVSLKGTEIGWSRGSQIPIEEYDNLYKQFNPQNFDADLWVSIAKAAGMKYIVLTTKHHDGFCLWNTKQTDHNIMNSPFKRDVVDELSKACKKQGIAFGAYYSTCDWYNPDFPLTSPGGSVVREKSDLEAYTKYLKREVAELLLNYSPLATLWFDVPQRFDSIRGQGIIDFVHILQPDIIINSRTGAKGDYDTPEQRVGKLQMDRPWETCMTICNQWAWKPNDQLKTLKECLHTLILSAAGDGNLLFNVGPTPDGVIEERQVVRLKQMGDWLKTNGESIYGTRGGPFLPGRSMASTRKDNMIYLHVFKLKNNEITLPALPVKIISAELMSGTKVNLKQSTDKFTLTVPVALQDSISTIIKLVIDKPAIDIPIIDPLDDYLATASNSKPWNSPSMLVDKSTDHLSAWRTNDDIRQAWVEIDLRKLRKFDQVIINEINGEQIKKFTVEYKKDNQWIQIYKGDKIGSKLICKFKAIKSQYIRLNILDSSKAPALSEIDIHEL
ncbi:MAG: alpha-L-fucosidase [Bacteroidetes bacterium]|nr:alpha-L-fucosidase [Bacteroidota bacterium]